MTQKTTGGLHEKISKLLREHLEAQRREALDALSQAFEGTAGPVAMLRQERAKGLPRRAAEDVTVLAEKMYEAICAEPGETMMTLSARMGATAIELKRPMGNLKKAGRIRSAGERNFTRYFPMALVKSGAA